MKVQKEMLGPVEMVVLSEDTLPAVLSLTVAYVIKGYVHSGVYPTFSGKAFAILYKYDKKQADNDCKTL